MIKGIRVGPRSRVLEAMDRANAELGAKVMGGLLPDDDQVAYPPTPGPANPTSVHGCGCARFHLPNKADLEIDGVVHRYSKPCYREGTSKHLGAEIDRDYIDLVGNHTLEERITALEKVVADLVGRVP